MNKKFIKSILFFLILFFFNIVHAQVAPFPAGTRTDYTVGNVPLAIAFDNVTNSVWVVNQNSDTISKVDINTGVRTDYPVGSNPQGIAFDNVTNSAWVTNLYFSTISKVDINTGVKIDYSVGDYPRGVAFDNITNSVWVANWISHTVSKVNINTGARIDYPVGNYPLAIAFDNITNSVWVANPGSNTVSKVDIYTGSKIDYSVEANPVGIAFDNITNSVWVTNSSSGTVSKVDIYTGAKINYSVGDYPIAAAFDNITNSVWVANALSNTISKIAIGISQPPQMINPTEGGKLKQGFDSLIGHYGIDIDKTLNQKPIKSSVSGIIVKIDNINDGNAGKWIWVSHGNVSKRDGSIAKKISTRYLHMDTIDSAMYVGKQVVQGEVIGTVGNTGKSTAPHLHFEVRQGDIPSNLDYRSTIALDPLNFVNYEKSVLSISAYSPVDIIITDPEGLIISKARNDFGAAGDYFELKPYEGGEDIDSFSGYEIVSIDQLKDGDYSISVVPEAGAQPNDVYTLRASLAGPCEGTIDLAKNSLIKDILDSPYVVKINNCSAERIVPIKINRPQMNQEYLLGSITQLQFSIVDNIAGTASVSAVLNNELISNNQIVVLDKPGVNIFTIIAIDNDGHMTISTQIFNVVYNFGGFLSPIKTDGSGVYNLGRTLPVKFQLTDADGSFISAALAYLYVAKISNGIVGTDEIPLSVLAADTGNQFRYDLANNQYIYNLSTDTLSVGFWQLKVVLDSGQIFTVIILIK